MRNGSLCGLTLWRQAAVGKGRRATQGGPQGDAVPGALRTLGEGLIQGGAHDRSWPCVATAAIVAGHVVPEETIGGFLDAEEELAPGPQTSEGSAAAWQQSPLAAPLRTGGGTSPGDGAGYPKKDPGGASHHMQAAFRPRRGSLVGRLSWAFLGGMVAGGGV